MELSEIQTVVDFLNGHPQLLPVLSILRDIQENKAMFTWKDILECITLCTTGDADQKELKELATDFINLIIARRLYNVSMSNNLPFGELNISDITNILNNPPTG